MSGGLNRGQLVRCAWSVRTQKDRAELNVGRRGDSKQLKSTELEAYRGSQLTNVGLDGSGGLKSMWMDSMWVEKEDSKYYRHIPWRGD